MTRQFASKGGGSFPIPPNRESALGETLDKIGGVGPGVYRPYARMLMTDGQQENIDMAWSYETVEEADSGEGPLFRRRKKSRGHEILQSR